MKAKGLSRRESEGEGPNKVSAIFMRSVSLQNPKIIGSLDNARVLYARSYFVVTTFGRLVLGG